MIPMCMKRSVLDCVLILAMNVFDALWYYKRVKINVIFQDANMLNRIRTENSLDVFTQNIKFQVNRVSRS